MLTKRKIILAVVAIVVLLSALWKFGNPECPAGYGYALGHTFKLFGC